MNRGCIGRQAALSRAAALKGGDGTLQSALVDSGIRVGRREGVALTLAVEVCAAAVAIAAIPEVRGKVQEVFSDAQRRVRDASFRLRHRGSSVEDSE